LVENAGQRGDYYKQSTIEKALFCLVAVRACGSTCCHLWRPSGEIGNQSRPKSGWRAPEDSHVHSRETYDL